MSDIADKIKRIVADHLGIDEAKVVPEASFVDDLGADSLDTVELIMAFEEEFDVEIPEHASKKSPTSGTRSAILKRRNKLKRRNNKNCTLAGPNRFFVAIGATPRRGSA
jgi:acyl carrier protein